MSMKTHPLNEVGVLVITGELAALINSQTSPADNGLNPADMTPEELAAKFGNISDAVDALSKTDVIICFCTEFQGAATPLMTPDDTNDHTIRFNRDYLVYVPCNKTPSLFEAAYPSFSDLVDEFRQKLTDAGFNLDGFPLENYVCEVIGIYSC